MKFKNKFLALLLTLIYLYGFIHVLSMTSEKTEHVNHDLCVIVLGLHEDIAFSFYKIIEYALFIFFISSVIYTSYFNRKHKIQKQNKENKSPPIIQELFSAGILNTKIYQINIAY